MDRIKEAEEVKKSQIAEVNILKILKIPAKSFGDKTHVDSLADFNNDEELIRRFNEAQGGDQQRVSQLID
jgi:hypothetical protein